MKLSKDNAWHEPQRPVNNPIHETNWEIFLLFLISKGCYDDKIEWGKSN